MGGEGLPGQGEMASASKGSGGSGAGRRMPRASLLFQRTAFLFSCCRREDQSPAAKTGGIGLVPSSL